MPYGSVCTMFRMQYGQLGLAGRAPRTLAPVCLQDQAPRLILRFCQDRTFSLTVPRAHRIHLWRSLCNLLLGISFWRVYCPLDSLASFIITLARFISGSATNE